ncbi:copper resistance CopC/CopD family protein [Polycladomyces subterraneus]|uniref:Copper resistance protein CopC n=1 Tax=Polycladomyces subterraneus TaxID=1016997 RepID=A0ABT8IHZ8_9BACL|nr:copper resistance protein CopC [Polycladomyces subterraneus]MDN4592363.1 copper resistance protein CopC [Polycladomyces subterraneus]
MKWLQPRGLKAFFLVTLLFALLFVPRTNCWAHAFLLESNPKDQQVLAHSPSQFWLRFSEPLQQGLFQIRLFDAQGREIDIEPHLDTKDPTRVVSSISSLPNGTYTIAWNVVSEDGHPVGGAITFSVGHPSDTKINPTFSTSSHFINWLSTVWHFLSETAILLIGGLKWVAQWFSRHRLPDLSSLVQRKTIRNWFLFCIVLIDGVLYVQTLPSLRWGASETWIALMDSHYIQMILVQLFLLMLVALPNMIEGWYLAIWLLLILSFAMGGHVWGTSHFWAAWLLRELHIVSIALWLGILTYLVLLYRWKRKENAFPDEKLLYSDVFFLASSSAMILFITGLWMVSVQSDWHKVIRTFTVWTSLLWVKITLFMVMLLIALVQTMMGRIKQTYNRFLLQLEWLIGVLVLFAGVWLSHSTFPIPVQHYEKTLISQQKTIRVEIAHLQVGHQPITVQFPFNSPIPERVTVQLSVPDKQVRLPSIVLKEKEEPHQYVGSVPFSFSGDWQIEIEAEYPDGTYNEWKDHVEIQGGEGS